ncbi:hypothetical protein AKJ37_03890 [candidate division MSBL1 archaeon SCGC-AAA259I09]|uniref:BPL/LPL catalytic domain-containing protein n=1 Tax=candidate division MSBL1 archaeon SCGC-AAA259I09 TaxID=1698267 RepID=A0A133US79_9EURY|nr:hypothetical protein AKJ37_03890 [candidate division MSBL1 archaeon SCGC-AAA259I09]
MNCNVRRVILEELKGAGSYVSGETLSERAGVSRVAIWKHVQRLKDEGYQIKSIRGRGYSLLKSPGKLLPYELQPLDVDVVGRRIIHLDDVGSTNLFLEGKAGEGEGLVVIAEEQAEGKGRMDRVWKSPEGGIWMSVLLKPVLPLDRAFLLSAISALAISESLQEVGLDAAVKWPNDVLVRGRKICGILAKIDGELDVVNYTIIGIGVNVNFGREELSLENVTTVKSELGREVDRKSMARDLIERLDGWYKVLKEGLYDDILNAWRTRSAILGQEIKIRKVSGEVYMGTAAGLSESGGLIVECEDGCKRTFRSGDATLLDEP